MLFDRFRLRQRKKTSAEFAPSRKDSCTSERRDSVETLEFAGYINKVVDKIVEELWDLWESGTGLKSPVKLAAIQTAHTCCQRFVTRGPVRVIPLLIRHHCNRVYVYLGKKNYPILGGILVFS
jgi:hypothetical protein